MASTTRRARAARRPDPRQRIDPARRPMQPDRAPVPRDVALTQAHAPAYPRTHARVRAHAWDTGVFGTVVLLLIIGLIALFSASYSNALFYQDSATYFIRQQGINAAIGLAAMIFISKITYKLYARFHKEMMIVSIILLILVVTPLGTASKGAQRWLSELAKITVIVCFAYWVSQNPSSVRSLRTMIKPYGFLLAVYIGLLYLEPHTSAMMIICGLGVVILVAGGMRLGYFVPIGVIGAVTLTAFYFAFEHVQERFAVWLDPFANMRNEGSQGAMSQIAIGSGGLLGVGLGESRQKQLYLPEVQNDFIFAVVCEELGFVGATLIIILFALLIWRGYTIALHAKDRFGMLIAVGITTQIGMQAMLNIAVVTNTIPNTGISLPFFSSGGTSLMMLLGEMGIVLSVSRQEA